MTPTTTTSYIILKCKKCFYEWNYKGEALYYTSCPRCRANIRIKLSEDSR